MSTPHPGHGAHWAPLLDVAAISRDWFSLEVDESELYGVWPLPAAGEGDEASRLLVLRKGGEQLCRQYLLAEYAETGTLVGLSGYPMLLDGIASAARIEAVEEYAEGIEGRIRCSVISKEVPVTFFDTMFFANGPGVAPGASVEVAFAALAMRLERVERTRFSVSHGPLWEYFRDQRLAAGETPEEALRVVECDMSRMTAYLPDDDYPEEAGFQGAIESVDWFEHFGLAVHRLEIALGRTDQEEWRIPVFATERVLAGYVPVAGDTVRGMLWLPGRIVGVGA